MWQKTKIVWLWTISPGFYLHRSTSFFHQQQLERYLCTAAAGAGRSSRAPSAAVWAVGPCPAACGPGRSPATAPAAAARPAASPAQPAPAAAYAPPRAETPPTVAAPHRRYERRLHISNAAVSSNLVLGTITVARLATVVLILAQCTSRLWAVNNINLIKYLDTVLPPEWRI